MPKFVFNDGSGPRVVTIPRWAMLIVGLALGGLGILLFILAAGFALILIPLAVMGTALLGWFARKRGRMPSDFPQGGTTGPAARRNQPDVIEADYQVIERKDRN
jgi:hypothetical protein